MTTYGRVKPAAAGPVADAYLELKTLCLFNFVLESEKIVIMSGLWLHRRNNSIFSFLLFQSQMSIDSWVNSSRGLLM